MGQRDAERVIDLGSAGEGRVETLRVHLAHDLEPDLARDAPMKLASRKFAIGLTADMDREGRCGSVEELLRMVVGEDDPQIGAQRPQSGTDLARGRFDAL